MWVELLLVILTILFTLLGILLWSGRGNVETRWVIAGEASNGNGTIAWSDNGESWTLALDSDGNYPFGDSGQGFVTNNRDGFWVAGGQDGDDLGKNMYWSDDGKEWNLSSNSDGSGQIFGTNSASQCRVIIDGGGRWVAAGGNPDSDKAYYSDDGKVWTVGNGTPNPGGSFNVFISGDYSPERFVLGATTTNTEKIWFSDDGINWEAANSPDGDIFGSGVGLVIDVKYRNGIWVAVGTNATTASENIWWSDNGRTWYKALVNPQTNNCTALDYYDGLWVTGGGSTNKITYSEDGKTWTAATLNNVDSADQITSITAPPGPEGRWGQ